MVDKNLFVYLTKSTGHTLTEAAAAMHLPLSALNRRLNGHIEFRGAEMRAWMALTGTTDAGPVFFLVCCGKATRGR